jgi:hypothetical protein
VITDQRFQLIRQRREATRERRVRLGLDLTIGDMRQAIAFSLDQSPAGRAEAGIEAEDLQARRSSSSSGTS